MKIASGTPALLFAASPGSFWNGLFWLIQTDLTDYGYLVA
jgi:hypothetical protein